MFVNENRFIVRKDEFWVKSVVASVFIFSIAYFFGIVFEDTFFLPVPRLIQMVSLFFFFGGVLIQSNINNIGNKFDRIVVLLFLGYNLFIISNGFIFSGPYIKGHLREPYFLLSFLLPFVVLLKSNLLLQSFVANIKLTSILFLLGYIFYVFFKNDQNLGEQFLWTFGTGSGFFLLSFLYWENPRIMKNLLIALLGLLMATVMGRRNIMLTFGGYIVGAVGLYYLYSGKKALLKKIVFSLVIIVALILGYYYFMSRINTDFSVFMERATVNSREELLFFFFTDFQAEDYFFGRGLNGTYYCPESFDIASPFGGDVDYRTLIEGGYLQMLLKGGLVHILLFMAVIGRAMWKGFVRSNNYFSKALAGVCLLWLIDMVPWGMPSFSVRYLMVWISISLLFNSEVLQKTDADIESDIHRYL
ncbi:MAG: hypothetical protein RR303_02530 [Bacteroidales bacterium]